METFGEKPYHYTKIQQHGPKAVSYTHLDVYKRQGSYENAKEEERDLLITDSHGFAQSKDLPYGLYIVHQTKGAEGQKFVPDFSVFISKHGKTYYFILNHPRCV